MAITVTQGVATISTVNTTSYASASFTPAASDQLICFVVASDTTDAGSLTDSQSLGWTKINTQNWTGGASRFYCFMANTLAAASSMTVTFSCTGDAATGAIIFVLRVAGAPTPAGTYVQVNGTLDTPAPSSTPAVTMNSSINTNNTVIAVCCASANPITITEPSGFTEFTETGYGNPSTGISVSYKVGGVTGTAVSWQSSLSTDWGVIVLELGDSGGGGGGSTPVRASVILKTFMGSAR